MRTVAACLLLVALAAVEAGCATGYVTYYEPTQKGVPVLHPDPYTRPPAPSGVALAGGALSVSCPNLRKFVLLPIPWFRRGFRPAEVQIDVNFAGDPSLAIVDVGAAAMTVDGKSIRPSRVEYQGERPAPVYFESIVLATRDRYKLEEPRRLTYTFKNDLGDADEFRMNIGEVVVDGTRTLIQPLTFTREGQFVIYRVPSKGKAAPADEEAEF